jgi:urease accessory protein
MSANASPSDITPYPSDLPAHVRVDAKLHLELDRARDPHKGDYTRIRERREEGAFRFRFPKTHGGAPEVTLVNIAGGLAGGDSLTSAITLHENAEMTLSSAAAERVYRSAGDATRLEAALTLGRGAGALWLPQETILHDGARLERRFSIDLAAGAKLLFGEMLYFGRRAACEGFTFGHLRESWRVRRAGRLVLADETRLSGDFGESLLHPVALSNHVAMATLLLAGEDAAEALPDIRDLLPDERALEAGTSDLGGLVLIRIAGEDAARLRTLVLSLAGMLAPRLGLALPRALT